MSNDRSDEIRVLVLKQRLDKISEFMKKEKQEAQKSGNTEYSDSIYRIYEEISDIAVGDRDEPVKLD